MKNKELHCAAIEATSRILVAAIRAPFNFSDTNAILKLYDDIFDHILEHSEEVDPPSTPCVPTNKPRGF